MIAIGIFSARKTKTMDGFLLGGRKIGAWVSAFAYGTSYFSAVIFVGYAGQHGWNIGLGSIWTVSYTHLDVYKRQILQDRITKRKLRVYKMRYRQAAVI